MAISEKNKEIITNRIAKRIDCAIDSWNKAGQMITDMAEKSNAYEMYKLAVKHKVDMSFVKLVYNEGTSDQISVVGLIYYDDGFRLDVKYRRMSRSDYGYIIGTNSRQSYLIYARDLIGHCYDWSHLYSSEMIAKDLVDGRIDTDSKYVIFQYENLNDDFAKILFNCVCDAMNKYIAIITAAYNNALQKERENDANVLSAFGLDDGSVVKVKPKQFKITIEEVKGE